MNRHQHQLFRWLVLLGFEPFDEISGRVEPECGQRNSLRHLSLNPLVIKRRTLRPNVSVDTYSD
jgi:hypothetical protein